MANHIDWNKLEDIAERLYAKCYSDSNCFTADVGMEYEIEEQVCSYEDLCDEYEDCYEEGGAVELWAEVDGEDYLIVYTNEDGEHYDDDSIKELAL